MSRVLLVAGLLMMVTGASAFAANDGVGNPGFGKGLANQLCGDCHIVSPDQQFSGGRLGPNLVERAAIRIRNWRCAVTCRPHTRSCQISC